MAERCESFPLPLPRAIEPQKLPRREVLTLGDGYQTSIYVHTPSAKVSGPPVVYLHGIQSHPGWFIGSAAAMAEAGRQVFQVTRRGSGDNTAARGHAHSGGLLLDDLEAACRFAMRTSGKDSVSLAGVSWGGKLAACYAAHRRRSVKIERLTLVAPGIVPRVDVSAAMKLSIAAALLVSPHRRFDIPLNQVELFTDDPEMRRYLEADPLRLHQATARFLLASRLLDRQLFSAGAGSLNMPVTLILSQRDQIINNDKTEKLMRHLAGDQLTVHCFSGCHTLEFESQPREFFECLMKAI